MILHVYEAAKKTNTGEVYVATPDQKIIDVITNNGGKAVLTSLDHQTGTDRVYEVFKNELKNEPSINCKFTRRYAKYRSSSYYRFSFLYEKRSM